MNSRVVRTVAVLWLSASVTYLQLSDFPFTPDSYAYVAAAKSLTERGDLTVPFASSRFESLPVPYTAWPPGYPLAIAAVHALGPDAWTSARLVSMFGMLIAAWIFACLVRPLPHGEIAFALLLVSWISATSAMHAWSEGPFAALLCGCLWATLRYSSDPQPHIGHLILAVACAGTSALFRYSGVFLLVPLFYLALRSRLRMHAAAGSLAALLAGAPLALWLWHNSQTGMSWRGAVPHPPAWWRAPAEFCRALGELSFAPVGVPSWIQAIAGAILIALVLLMVRRRVPRLRDSALAATASLFLVVFAVGIVAARSLGLAGVLTPRLIWPVLPFVALIVVALAQDDRSRKARWPRLVVPALIAAQSLSVILAPRVYPSLEQRLGNRTLPEFLQAEPALLANRGWEAWRQTRRTAYYVPMHPHDELLLAPDTLAAWARRRGVRYLAWFAEGATPGKQRALYGDLYGALDGGRPDLLEPVWQRDSLVVYRIGP